MSRTGIKIIHDFTRDPNVLIAALKRVKLGGAEAVKTDDLATDAMLVVMQEMTDVQSWVAGIEKGISNSNADQRRIVAGMTIEALNDIARAFGTIPGRKSLIWITSNLPTLLVDAHGPSGVDSSLVQEYERTWKALNASGIAIYPVDATGLDATLRQNRPPARATIGQGHGSDLSGAYGGMEDVEIQTHQNMQRMAEVTGGIAYYNRNDLAVAMKNAVDDSSEYYLLAFRPEPSDKPIWRKLTVRVPAQSAAKIRSRNSYLYVPQGSTDAQRLKKEVEDAVLSPFDYSGVPLQLSWTGTISDPSSVERRIGYQVKMLPEMEADTNHFNLSIWTLPRLPDGSIGNVNLQSINGKPSPETVQRIKETGGVVYRDHLQLKPGEYTIKIVVRDNVSGQVGTVTAPLKVE